MPLFLDLHKAADYEAKPTVEEIKKNHIADLSVQKKYGVKFIQYWLNEDEGLVFCLMEGPDKEACAAVHQEAHGNMPCNVIELKGGDYKTYMGEAKPNEFDIAENPDGTFDNGSRTFLAVEILISTNISLCRNTIQNAFKDFHGREATHPGGRLLATFNNGRQAVGCACHILKVLKEHTQTEVLIGMSAGHPLTDKENFFEVPLRLTNRLCDVAQHGQIYISANLKDLSHALIQDTPNDIIRVMTWQDENFVNRLLDILEPSLGDVGFNVDTICRSIGVSRAQLYRKLILLTGLSPNTFVKELRLRRAIRLMKNKYGNIAEVAYETGFSSPSYFSSVFQKRFGLLPSQYPG